MTNTTELLSICRDRFTYDPLTGNFIYRKDIGGRKNEGDIAGSVNLGHGYIQIGITIGGKLKMFLAHRLAFLMMTGSFPIADTDHINGVKSDNRWINLRQATRQENLRNRKSWGKFMKGVSKLGKKFRAQINIDGVQTYLGTFDTELEAHLAYCEVAEQLHGAFINTGDTE